MDASIYDKDYYEHGPESGKSCYQNYRWIPELTIPMAMTIIDFLDIKRFQTILDYGCAKGFLVKALRLLYRDAWGIDVSSYAIENLDSEVENYCCSCPDKGKYGHIYGIPKRFDFCIAKDVFEHIPREEIPDVLENIKANILFAIIPLGDNGKFIAPANNCDITHVTCRPAGWWKSVFIANGWKMTDFRYRIDGIKDSYYEKYPEAHGFFTLRRPIK